MIRILIIENDIEIATELEIMVKELRSDVYICGILRSVKQSLEWFALNQMPSLIISDTEIADESVFNIFKSIRITSPVIFCTACEKCALPAFENNGVDYLLKPVKKNQLQKSFDKLFNIFNSFPLWNILPSGTPPKNITIPYDHNYKSSLLTFYKEKIIPIAVSEIRYISYAFTSVFVHADNKRFEIRETMDRLMSTLPPNKFFRANRQYIITRSAIVEIEQLPSRKLSITLTVPDSEIIVISKDKSSEFLNWLEWS